MARNKYAPSVSVTTVRSPWRAGEVAVIVAPGRASPCWSFTVPRIVPVCTPCAKLVALQTSSSANARNNSFIENSSWCEQPSSGGGRKHAVRQRQYFGIAPIERSRSRYRPVFAFVRNPIAPSSVERPRGSARGIAVCDAVSRTLTRIATNQRENRRSALDCVNDSADCRADAGTDERAGGGRDRGAFGIGPVALSRPHHGARDGAEARANQHAGPR